jgi:hypothetical protein
MKTMRFLCGLLLSHSVSAALIDFNDIAIGTEVSSLNPYGAAVISTRFWVNQHGTTVAESFTRGVIGTGPNGSPSVVIEAGIRDLTDPEQLGGQLWNIDIGVSFQAPMSTFSIDAFSGFWSAPLIYSGVNALGEIFTSSAHIPARIDESFTHFDIVAPTGGYITGFHFSQFENFFDIHLAMDNLDYTLANSVPVPETIGLPTFVFAICGLLFAHRRMKAGRN